ncbi:peptide-methionine (S)-S-oxide reductase MsrA [Pedobacter boryungensis]|uniref:Peptide methionine sulfoxide reductase MsrA n=1 Tax=Pedobacter boryungensis TaxID=869962 RepID=A0ABX2D8K4_9SPHI|nr:peptide-methionine (S)-S-oxide reductase MsrA [Pedobacter boryungensis]NQX30300.1 peptide-methionine (S)-S-oxide reductase MsrA [Pedobacter boryungensis]
MKNLIAFLFVIVFFSCSNAEEKVKAEVPKVSKTQRVAVFAGGCFWGLQEGFSELKGVIKTTSGYAGGTTKNPSYEDVNTETTGHAEAVQIVYDPSVISFAQLLDVFFVVHDGTQLNRQGPDIGTSYRSIAFYSNPEEKRQIEAAIVKSNRSQLHPGQIVTEVKPMATFYPAEKYHQNFVKLNPNQGYVVNVCGPKIQKLRKAFPNLLKDEFK